MPVEPVITFRRMKADPALDGDIRKRVASLERFCPTIIGARVLVEPVERSQRSPHRIHVRVELSVPGEDVIISHETSARGGARATGARSLRKQDEPAPQHKDIELAIHDAFRAARRRLQDYLRRRRGQVKRRAGAER
ncbi:MAG: HPF/RaiA family ribosome-associated protein [Acidobacteria bacterium]|nr:HPF/RaiA family ribosome-associated protein [Acidobacteriota bacterium]